MNVDYQPADLTRDQVASWRGAAILAFGANWCGHCQAATPLLIEALRDKPELRLETVEDGKGRPLGRSFGVKLWPTFVLLVDGAEVGRIVRPTNAAEFEEALQALES